MAKNPALYFSKAWHAIRSQQLKRHPYCYICQQLGLKVKASEVDHIQAARLGGLSLSAWNLQSLCKTHHSQKTAHGPEQGSCKTSRPFVVTGPDGYLLPAGIIPPKEDES